MIEKNPVTPIEPVFVDYSKDLDKTKANKEIPILYKKNEENSLFNLYYVFDMGTANDRRLPIAFNYLDYLGTATLSPEKFKEQMLMLACSFFVISQTDKTYVVLTGLSENMESAMTLMEDLLSNATENADAFANVISQQMKVRADNKLNFNYVNRCLQSYGKWGAVSPTTYVLSNEELARLTPQEMVGLIRGTNQYRHQIWYYEPKEVREVVHQINKTHKVEGELKEAPAAVKFEQQPVNQPMVYLADFPSKQTNITLI